MLFDQPAHIHQRRPSTTTPVHTFSHTRVPENQLYSNSAPSSTVGFRPPRPPVPLFNSSGQIHQQTNPNNTAMTGKDTLGELKEEPILTDVTALHTIDFNLGRFDGSGELSWDTTDTFTSINGGASSTQTVSPKDIFNDGLGSAPPSTALTNLTSPDIKDSPYLDSTYNPSPMFPCEGDLIATTENWFPLFPDAADASTVAPVMERDVSNTSFGVDTGSSDNSPLVMDVSNVGNRKKSSDRSPAMMTRHSSSSGINRRRRKGPLPPIEVDPSDKVAVKRARNTLAARESRQRKLDHVTTLESRVEELEDKIRLMKSELIAHGYNGPLILEQG